MSDHAETARKSLQRYTRTRSSQLPSETLHICCPPSVLRKRCAFTAKAAIYVRAYNRILAHPGSSLQRGAT